MSLMSAGLKPFYPFDPEVMDDPYPYFAWMRENNRCTWSRRSGCR